MPIAAPPPDPVVDAVADAVDAVFLRFPDAAGEILAVVLRSADARPAVLANPRSSGASILWDLWPVALWCGGALVVTLSAWQIGLSLARRDGRGLVRSLTGVIQYALVTASIIVVVQSIATVCDELARWVLSVGLDRPSFWSMRGELMPVANPDVSPILALVVGLVGVIGALALGLELSIGQLISVSLLILAPIAAAGLAAGTTRRWLGTLVRWAVVVAVAKPVAAVVAVVGVRLIDERGSGLPALLGGLTTVLAMVAVVPILLRVSHVMPAAALLGDRGSAATRAASGAVGGSRGSSGGDPRASSSVSVGAPAGHPAAEVAMLARLGGGYGDSAARDRGHGLRSPEVASPWLRLSQHVEPRITTDGGGLSGSYLPVRPVVVGRSAHVMPGVPA